MRLSVPVLVVSIAFGTAALPNTASATCAAPDPKIVWSSPSDGATEVPTNAAIWLLLANWHQPPELTLNGARVPVAELPFLYRPGVLQPRTRYEVKLIATPVHAQTPVELTWVFTTGDGPSPPVAPAPPVIERVSTTQSRELDELCTAVWRDCYDTGQNTHLLFHVAGPAPLVWVVERVPQAPEQGEGSLLRLWPGVCGTPEAYVTMSEAEGCFRPYRLHAGDLAGLTAASEPVCPSSAPYPTPDAGESDASSGADAATDQAMGTGTSRRGSGCAIVGATEAGGRACASLPFVGAVLTTLISRRSRRRSRVAR